MIHNLLPTDKKGPNEKSLQQIHVEKQRVIPLYSI